MKNLTLTRDMATDEGTFGTLTLNGVKFQTLELPWRDNESFKSCIPGGTTYRVEWTYSPKYDRKMYLVHGDHGRDGIRIHSANWAGDEEKGWLAQLLGCIALGRDRATMAPKGRKPQKAITSSRDATQEFETLMAGESFELTILERYLAP